MKKSNVVSIKTAKSIEAELDFIIYNSGVGIVKQLFPDIRSLLIDDKRLINWEEEEDHPCYKGSRLVFGSLVRVPPFPIPAIEEAIPLLNEYKSKLEDDLLPFEITKKSALSHSEVFKNSILTLINCYPTYCSKSESFKNETILNFFNFLSPYPLILITRSIHEWIATHKEFPTISVLIEKIERKLTESRTKILRIEKVIKESKSKRK